MRSNGPVGSISKGIQPDWAFDMQGMSLSWRAKAEELDRMVWLGYAACREDTEEFRAYRADPKQNALPSKPRTFWVTFFLAATAIENLLKANLVVEHPECISKGRFQGKVIGKHNLLRIAEDAGIALNPDERDFCELGSEAIRSFGRYPIGKSMASSPSRLRIGEYAFSTYQRLYDRLWQRIAARPWKNYSPKAGAADPDRSS